MTTANDFVKNANYPFTELFSHLPKYETLPDKTVTLAYSSEKLKLMRDCINNAMEIMLRGLQDVGNLLAATRREKMKDLPVEGIGQFISATCNLIEALNSFGLDADYVLVRNHIVS